MKQEVRKRLFGLILLFSSVVLAALWAMAGEPSRLVIIPFKMNADRDLSFMKQGIADMLTSRLSWGDTMVVGRHETDRALEEVSGPVNDEIARGIGATLQADYVLFGSLTMLGNSISLDARMVNVRQKRPALTFFRQGEAIDDVIPQTNLLATQINESVFGRAVGEQPPPEQATEPRATYTHPENLMDEAVSDETEVSPAPVVAESGAAAIVDATPAGTWRSPNFEIFIKGIAIGDVDGDSRSEVVFISDRQIYVYRFENKRLLKIKEMAGKRYQRFIGVDVADINGNGYAEIFVTSLKGTGQRLDSFVLEWTGDNFKQVHEGGPWYYRVIDMPGRGRVLLGQKRTIVDIFVPGVYRLSWQNGEYGPEERLALPKSVNIFGFAVGDVTDTGEQMTVAFDDSDHIRLFALSGEEQWKSAESYGGSMNYLEFSMEESAEDTNRFYLPQRIFIRDLNRDGENEVILASNEGMLGRLLARFRSFESGHMASLSWKSHGLALNWQTPKVSGHISDYDIGDFDNDGEDEVLIVQAREQGTALTSSRSLILGYEPTPTRNER